MILDHQWQLPISSENGIAHYFLHTDCHVWTQALCGVKVNPAFAQNGDGAKRCANCERKLDE
jgi:hypothetical protein